MAQLLCVNKCSVISVPFMEGYQALDYFGDFTVTAPAHREFSVQPAHVCADVFIVSLSNVFRETLTGHVDSVHRVAVVSVYLGGMEDTPVIKFE